MFGTADVRGEAMVASAMHACPVLPCLLSESEPPGPALFAPSFSFGVVCGMWCGVAPGACRGACGGAHRSRLPSPVLRTDDKGGRGSDKCAPVCLRVPCACECAVIVVMRGGGCYSFERCSMPLPVPMGRCTLSYLLTVLCGVGSERLLCYAYVLWFTRQLLFPAEGTNVGGALTPTWKRKKN